MSAGLLRMASRASRMPRVKGVLAGAALLAAAGTAQAAVVDFNTAGDLVNNFFSEDVFDAAFPLAEADGVGIGGSRGLSVVGTNDAGLVYDVSSLPFNTSGTSLAVSVYIRTANPINTASGEARVLEANFITVPDQDVAGAHIGAGGKVQLFNNGGNTSTSDDVEIEFRRSNADVAPVSTPGFDILPGRWYKVTFTMTNQGAGQAIPATVVLDDYGTDGTSLVAAGVYGHSLNLAAEDTLTSDGDVYGAFRVRSSARLFDAMDNFEITVVPEPTAGLAVAAGALGLLARRRQRRAR